MPYPENEKLHNWLDRETPETVIEPELPIIDPHHHLWDIRSFDIEPHASFQEKVYLCEEISNDIRFGGHNITHTVFAQCGAFYRVDGPEPMQCVGETEFVQGIVAMSRSGLYGSTRLCAGIFGTADLRPGKAVEEVLQTHLAASSNFRGIRSAYPGDLNPEFMQGYAVLGKLNLSYDHYSPDVERLPVLAKLAKAFPDVPVIVNHLGGKIDPDAGPDAFANWRSCIDAIASCPNAFMKVGGAQQRVGSWEPPFHMNHRSEPISSEQLCDLLYPFYRYAIEAFGPDRCMFESNFPVDKECVSYRTLWNAFKRIAARAGLSESEKAAMFSGTAARVYRLDELPR
ncbi:MAG: amidohydrolase family protein [bacterium]|nr:amidohydrolase [Gammaproteobacteria bacterium]HIL94789.1 amidohydrolase [Pseudomonadales bacterium]